MNARELMNKIETLHDKGFDWEEIGVILDVFNPGKLTESNSVDDSDVEYFWDGDRDLPWLFALRQGSDLVFRYFFERNRWVETDMVERSELIRPSNGYRGARPETPLFVGGPDFPKLDVPE